MWSWDIGLGLGETFSSCKAPEVPQSDASSAVGWLRALCMREPPPVPELGGLAHMENQYSIASQLEIHASPYSTLAFLG